MEKISINYDISNDKIKVESSSTVFINIVRGKAVDIIQLDKDIKELRKICKERKIIFSQKNGLYKFFKENKNNYLEELNNLDKLKWRIDAFYYAGTTISNINSLNNNVKNIYQDLKRKDVTIEKIYL